MDIKNCDDLCRICLEEMSDNSNYLINLNEYVNETENISYLNAFEKVTGFSIQDTEPQNICFKCSRKLNSAYDLIKVAENTQEILGGIYPKIEVTEIKVEIDPELKMNVDEDPEESEEKNDNINSDSDSNPQSDTENVQVKKKVDKSKKCYFCQKTFKRPSSLLKHMNAFHSKERNKSCEFCSKKFFFDTQLEKHVKYCKSRPKTLEECNEKSEYLRRYLKNYRQRIVCPVCGILATKEHWKIHEKPPEDEIVLAKQYICDLCGLTLGTRPGMEKHMKYSHLNHKAKCKFCVASFKNPSALSRHYRKFHSDITQEYRCRYCDFSTKGEHEIRRHRTIHTGVKIFKCEVCGSEFLEKAKLQIHMATHSDARPFVCETCGSSFKTKKALGVHNKTHKPYDYECPVCSRAYLTNQLMRNHVVKNHPEYELPPPGTILNKSWRMKLAQRHLAELALQKGLPPDQINVEEALQKADLKLFIKPSIKS